MVLPTFLEFITKFIIFDGYEKVYSPNFTEYFQLPNTNFWVRFKTREEHIIALYLYCKENPKDSGMIKRLNLLRMGEENIEISEEELCTLYSFPFYTGEKSWNYVLSYKRGQMPEEVKQKISMSETGQKRSPEVGRKISETKQKRKEERLAQMSNSFPKGSNINSDELSNETEESTHSEV
jgi:hypothetical protein